MFRESESGGSSHAFTNKNEYVNLIAPNSEAVQDKNPTEAELARLQVEATARDRDETKLVGLRQSAEIARQMNEPKLAEIKDERVAHHEIRADRAGTAALQSYDREREYLARLANNEVSGVEEAARARTLDRLQHSSVTRPDEGAAPASEAKIIDFPTSPPEAQDKDAA